MKLKFIAYAVSLVAVSGCSSNDEKPAEQVTIYQKELIDIKPVMIDTTLQYKSLEQNTGSLTGEGYIHVLGKQNYHNLIDTPTENNSSMAVSGKSSSSSDTSGRNLHAEGDISANSEIGIPVSVIKNAAKASSQSYSVYELSRWERFCGLGGKMDVKDWDFISDTGRANLPDSLKSSCKERPYTSGEYRATWEKTCTEGYKLNTADRIITNETIKPKGICSK